MSGEAVRLGDLCDVVRGSSPRPKGDLRYFGGNIPWVLISDVTRANGPVLTKTVETVTEAGKDRSRYVEAGQLIVSNSATIGLPIFMGMAGCIHDGFLTFLNLDTRLTDKWLYWYFLFARKRLALLAPEGTQKNLNIDIVENIPIPLPSLPDQCRIAAQLDQADRLRCTRRYALELSDSFLPAVFLELFGDPEANPAGFPTETIGSVFSTEREGAKCGPFGSALKKHEYVNEGIPVWTMENVGENEFRESGCLYITPEKFEELQAYDAQDGDILISRAGTVGRMAIVETVHPRSIIHSNIIRLSLDSSRCLPIFFVVLMTFFSGRVGRLKRGQEDAYTFMNTGRLAELRISLPPLPLQQQFANLVAQHERLRAVQRESLRQAEHLFQSLLHEAFTTSQ